MSYPLRIAGSLNQHLRALRRKRGLTQAQLGDLVGVKQARIAEIEANPGTVGLEQLIKVLAALGATLHLHEETAAVSTAAAKRAKTTKKAATGSSLSNGPARPRTAKSAPAAAPRRVVIPARKGAW